MIDREAREKAANALERFRDSRITNRQYETAWPWKSNDPGVQAVYRAAWYYYDDFTKHKLTGKHQLADRDCRLLDRCVRYLKSDLEYEWEGDPGDENFLWEIPEEMGRKLTIGSLLLIIGAVLAALLCLAANTGSLVVVPIALLFVVWLGVGFLFLAFKMILPLCGRGASSSDQPTHEIDLKPQMRYWPFKDEQECQLHCER